MNVGDHSVYRRNIYGGDCTTQTHFQLIHPFVQPEKLNANVWDLVTAGIVKIETLTILMFEDILHGAYLLRLDPESVPGCPSPFHWHPTEESETAAPSTVCVWMSSFPLGGQERAL